MDRLGRRAEDAVALLALAVGAWLRFDGLGTPSYWLDEVLHQTITRRAASQPWWRWLAPFEPENGPLYYATQLFGRSEVAGRFFPALFGLAAIALVWLAARQLRATTAPLLLAVSPLAVYYSREARPYALLMMLTAGLIVLLLRGRSALAIAVLVAILYSGAMGAPIVIAVLLVALILRWWSVAGGAGVVLVLFPLFYRTTTHVVDGPAFPALDASFAMTLLRNVSVSALGAPVGGRAAVAMFALATVGAVVLARRDRRAGLVVIAMTVVPAVVTLGALWKFGHWYGPRYIAPFIGGYVLLAGVGIGAISHALTRPSATLSRSRGRGAGWALARVSGRGWREAPGEGMALLIAVALATQAWPQARTEPFLKLDWRAIAAKIEQYAHPGDMVIAGDQWSEAPLRYYLRGVRLEGVPYPAVAEALTYSHPGTWLVTAGFGGATRNWMCRYPVVLASALEGFRLHYNGDFLRERAGPAEWRALAAALGPHALIDLAAPDDRFLREGWALPEGFRWAVGTRASVAVPRWGARDRVIRMRVTPMENAALPLQTVRVLVNAQPIGELTLRSGWEERQLRAPAAAWRDGMNTLTFDFGRAAAPADLDPKATDRRPLAAAFAWIVIDDEPGQPRAHAYAIRIASAPFIDENSAWRRTETRFPPEQLRRDALEALAGRLGFDPAAASRARLENLVESVSYGSDCEDDQTFVQRAFMLLLDRPPDPSEERALSSLPRARLPVRLTKSEEFRRAVLATAPDRASAPGTHTPDRRTP